MGVEGFLAHYGVMGLFLGAGVEGEAVVVTGGVLAQRHLIPLWAAMLASATGSCIVDQIWFFLGRYCRRYAWVQKILRKPTAARAVDFVTRYPRRFVFGFRFVYGLRTVSPIVIGTTTIPIRTFVVLNVLAAAIWGPLFTLVGYAFGRAAETMLGHVQSIGPYVLGGLAILLVAVAGGIALWRRQSASPSESIADRS